MSRPRQVTVLVDKITFDPDDEVTQSFHPEHCCFYIMENLETVAVLKPGDAPAKLILSEALLNDPNAVLRLLVKDHSMSQEGEHAQVGTISLNMEYFRNVEPKNYGQRYQQNITLFDDVDDDEFDGELGEDDEEMPMIRTAITVEEAPLESTPSPQKTLQAPTPQRPVDRATPQANGAGLTVNAAKAQATAQPSSMVGRGSMSPNEARSPTGRASGYGASGYAKRKTVVTTGGQKKVVAVEAPALQNQRANEGQSPRSPGSSKVLNRRMSKAKKINDIFGDFFGFGPNPLGCMAKGNPNIDVKKEKEKFMSLLTAESKRYDIQGMHTDLNNKTNQIVQSIKKEEKHIIDDEERQLRNLDKLDYMSQYLQEDNVSTRDSLAEAQRIKDNSQREMQEFESSNRQDLDELEQQVRQMEQMISESENQQRSMEDQNRKLQKALQQGRDNDFNKNQGQIDEIKQKDDQFDILHKNIAKAADQRSQNLNKFHQASERANNQTKQTEQKLKDLEASRHTSQTQREDLEKKLSDLVEKNLDAQGKNYTLTYQSGYFKQKTEQAEAKIKLLEEKHKFLTTTLAKQVRDQAEHANEVDVESKKLKLELERQRDEELVKRNELAKLEDSNGAIKRQGYDRQIDDLNRSLFNHEKQRTEFQHKLETTHSTWTCKLNLFVTDMNQSSQKNQADLKQIQQLILQMQQVSQRQAQLLEQRQALMLGNFENEERREHEQHLHDQITDTEQMIEETKVQIQEIQDQIGKINSALEERQGVINDQIRELNVIRQQKIDLDKQIQLQTSQITDLNRHIERYESDIERLTEDKEQLIERLNDLSQNVALKIDQIEDMETLLRNKDKIIEIMNKKIRDKQSKPIFTMPKGDTIDTMLNYYMNTTNCPVPIRKCGNGFYLFGTKKIYAKILNGKLVIRVGGGFMIIEEFIATYADNEMNKISKMSEEQLAALGADSTSISISSNPAARLSYYRNVATKGKSPTASSLLYKPDARLSGTNRLKGGNFGK